MKKKTYITPSADIFVIPQLALLNGSPKLDVKYDRGKTTEEALSRTFDFDEEYDE